MLYASERPGFDSRRAHLFLRVMVLGCFSLECTFFVRCGSRGHLARWVREVVKDGEGPRQPTMQTLQRRDSFDEGFNKRFWCCDFFELQYERCSLPLRQPPFSFFVVDHQRPPHRCSWWKTATHVAQLFRSFILG